jgi:hypothetical protein
MSRIFHFHAPRQPREAAVPVPERPPARSKPAHDWSERRIAIYVAALALIVLIVLVELARAGGPQYVAGTSYFNAGIAGQPITWSGGTVTYYTDQGDLSPILRGPGADTFVADAFSRWTQVPTAALSASRDGQLAEDVSGANVILNSDYSITLPPDIQPTATTKPIAIVYDTDGAVTNALIGAGASDECFSNGVFGGVDAMTTDGHLSHALLVLDGMCGQTSSQLPDMKYHLVRVLGRVLGHGWSQTEFECDHGCTAAEPKRLRRFSRYARTGSGILCARCGVLSEPRCAQNGRSRGALAPLSRHQRQPLSIPWETDFVGEHGAHSRVGEVHGFHG